MIHSFLWRLRLLTNFASQLVLLRKSSNGFREGSTFFASADELHKMALKAPEKFTVLEVFSNAIDGLTFVKPYFDQEIYCSNGNPGDDVIEEFRQILLKHVQKFMDHVENFDVNANTIFAYRHGMVKHEGRMKFKISWRAWVTGFKIDYTKIGKMIEAKGLATATNDDIKGYTGDGGLDKGIYKAAEQLLGCVLGRKGNYHGHCDNRVLTPCDPAIPYSSFLVRHLDGNEVLIPDLPSSGQKKAKAKPKQKRTPRLASEEPCEEHAPDEDLNRLLSMMHPQRWESYIDWRNIAFALIDAGGACSNTDHHKELWLKMSRQSSKFVLEEAETAWAGFARDTGDSSTKITVRTLHHMAREDSPQLYAEFANSLVKGYAATKLVFEEEHFKIELPLTFATVYGGVLTLKKRHEFRDTYENLFYFTTDPEGQRTSHQFVPDWFKDVSLRSYRTIDFLPPPCQVSAEVYNLWPGFAGEQVASRFSSVELDQVDLQPALDHLNLLCGNDPASFDYVMKFHAQIIQAPGELTGVALIMRSEKQGVGKNTWLDWFGQKVLGTSLYTTTARVDALLGRFGNGAVRKLLVNLDEAKGSETFNLNDRIKNAITAHTIESEEKGQAILTLRNFARWVFTSNSRSPVKIEISDRRFVCLDCCEDRANDRAYFTSLLNWMSKEVHIAAFYHHLKNLDISTVDWVQDRPKSALWEELRTANVPVLARWLDEVAEMKSFEATWIPGKQLFAAFREWVEKGNHKCEWSVTKFGTEVKKYEGVSHKRSNGSHYWIVAEEVTAGLARKGYVFSD